MKQLRGYIVVTAVIVVAYILVALWLDRESLRQHEQDFNQQQALQTRLSASSIEDHFEWQLRDIQIVVQHVIPPYLAHDPRPEQPDSIFGAIIDNPDTQGLAFGFFESPTNPLLLYMRPDTNGDQAARLLNGWLSTYWDTVRDSGEPFVTPFYVTSRVQLYGVLVPVFIKNKFAGIAAATLDFAPVLERYVVPVRSGTYGAAWVQDANSHVIYDHEPETIGQHVSSISKPYPDLERLNLRLMQEDSGLGEYHYTEELGGHVARKLVAWSTARMGNQRLTIALSAPDTEISAALAESRQQIIILGLVLAISLVVSGGLLYYLRQRTLQKEVMARTAELQQLTADLEQRVARRTTQLEQERAQLRTVLEAMDEGVLYRQGSQVLYANEALSTLLGYTNDELLGAPREVFKAVIRNVDPALTASKWQNIQEVIAQRGVWRHEARLTRKDGTQFDASIYVANVRSRQHQALGVVEIIRDISLEKRLQAQRDRFITNAAHELRRPLANLKTRIYLLGRQPEKLLENAEIIQKATDDMAELVQDLVDMAHLSTDQLSLNRRRLILQHVLRSAMDIQQEHAYRVRVKITADLPEAPVYAHADYQRLTQTFNNLLAHAIHSTAPDGQVGIRLYQQPERACIDIDDDGPALDPGHLAYIFEPFFEPSEGTVRRSGIGLALARQIIENHGGHIAASITAENNRLTVQLPLDLKSN